MAQADETGDEGEGRSDDGFVEGNDPGGSGRRRKKRQPGGWKNIQILSIVIYNFSGCFGLLGFHFISDIFI